MFKVEEDRKGLPVVKEKEEGGASRFFGGILILIGMGMGGWVFYCFYRLLENPDQLEIFTKLASKAIPAATANVGFTVPPALFTSVAYVVCLILLSLSIGLTAIFINGGVNLYSASRRVERAILRALIKNKAD